MNQIENFLKKCPNCGAPVDEKDKVCSYCSAPIVLSEEVQKRLDEELNIYIKNAEEKLKENKNKYDPYIFGTLLITTSFLVIIYILMKNIATAPRIIIIVILSILSFAFWGILIEKSEAKAVKEFFEAELKDEIRNFIQEHQITFYDFSKRAGEILEKNARLRQFLF
ncbi:zinc ribbon domain-containing protein [Candidatus Dependentiae bacterium]|nr:zinc ribbon domain-containing protein [Candidatus Dependentiae bacterium]